MTGPAIEDGRPVLTLAQARGIALRLRQLGVAKPDADPQLAVRAITDVVPVWDEQARDWAGRPAPQDGAA